MKDILIRELEELAGFPINRKEITIEESECHDENLSYPLCLRFYGKEEEIGIAIDKATATLRYLDISSDRRTIEHMNAFLGNLYYLKGDFPKAMAYFMRNLTLNRRDITPWIESLFCLRAMGHFLLFEQGIFNFRKLVYSWQREPVSDMNQSTMISLIKRL